MDFKKRKIKFKMVLNFCYILKNETGRNTYVGYTNAPPRRLRQHNGEIAGGARYTSRHGRAWSIVAVVTCPLAIFDKRRALSLEWHMKPHGKSRPGARQDPVLRRIDLLSSALALEKFGDVPLFWVHVVDKEYQGAFAEALEGMERVEIIEGAP
jgi:predicted GIY-YIG superfamily endonuclease